MKCPSCGNNQKASFGMTCSSCSYQFALNPKEKPYLTDGRLLGFCRAASANDTYFFTMPQLYATAARKTGSPRNVRIVKMLLGVVVLAIGIGLVIISSDLICPTIFCALIGGGLFLDGFQGNWGKLPAYSDFVAAAHKYQAKRGEIPKLIENTVLHDPPPNWPEDDIFDYGVERVLVVQHDLMVDQYVLNGMHTEHRCAIVAASGYPTYISDRIGEMLEANPSLPVFFLHDPNETGMQMRERFLESPPFLLPSHPNTYDIGLTPDTVSGLPSMREIHKRVGGVSVMHLAYGSLVVGLGLSMLHMQPLHYVADNFGTSDTGSTGYG